MSGNSNGKHNGVDIRSESPLETLGNAVSKAIDPYGVTTSLLAAQTAWLMHPLELSRAANALSGDLLALQSHVMRRALGIPSADVIQPHADDALWRDLLSDCLDGAIRSVLPELANAVDETRPIEFKNTELRRLARFTRRYSATPPDGWFWYSKTDQF